MHELTKHVEKTLVAFFLSHTVKTTVKNLVNKDVFQKGLKSHSLTTYYYLINKNEDARLGREGLFDTNFLL